MNVAQKKSNDVHNYPGYKYESGRVSTICAVHDLTLWLVCLATESESLDRFPGVHLL